MSNMVECGTCGYPLTPEERTSLVEHNGRMVKPWQSLTGEEIAEAMVFNKRVMVAHIENKLKEKNS